MTDLKKTLAYLEDMGYKKLDELPYSGKAGFRNYFHDRLYISCDRSSFTFNKDESLAGIGYGPPPYWLTEYRKTGQEARSFYKTARTPVTVPDCEDNDEDSQELDWDAPITDSERLEMDNWENDWGEDE